MPKLFFYIDDLGKYPTLKSNKDSESQQSRIFFGDYIGCCIRTFPLSKLRFCMKEAPSFYEYLLVDLI